MMIRGEYTPDWPAIAKIVKAEAAWRCVRCNHRHDVAAARMLTVHHFDGDKSNNQRWNLMALCQACHLSVQARVDPRVPLMFDPASWAMPYIAGFYASGGGVPGPLVDVERWRLEYEQSGRTWPAWAPRSTATVTM
jgi:hypothetical protein